MLQAGIPTFDYPEKLVRIMNYIRQPKIREIKDIIISINSQGLKTAKNIINSYKQGGYMNIDDCFKLLDIYGINMVKSKYIQTANDIYSLMLNYPLVAKIDHDNIIHKSDVGGVILNIQNSQELLNLFNK